MTQFDSLTVPGLTDDEQRTVNRLLGELEARSVSNRLRQRLYDNKDTARRIGDTIPHQYFRMGIALGWTGKAVDGLNRRSKLDSFVWADGDIDSLGARRVWDQNHLRSEISSAQVSSLIHGPSFLVNTVGVEGEPESLIHVRDALSATGTWNPRRRTLEDFISVTNRDENNKVTGFVLYFDGLTVSAVKEQGRWTVDRQDHPWGMPVEVMPYKPRVERPFGSSRISDPIIGFQRQAVRALIRLEGHMDIYSYPDFWLLGAMAKDVKGEADGNVAAMAAALGRIRGIPDLPVDDPNARDSNLDRADIKQFPASAPTPNLAALNAIAKLFAREANLPDSAVAITDMANPTSGDSYDASQYELIADAEGAMDDWTPAVKKTFVRALQILNGETIAPPEWLSIEPRWRDPRYTSKAALADAGLKQIQAVPWLAESEVGLELLGLDAQQIRRALADQRRMGGSAALRAVTETVESGADMKAKFDALGSAIRSGVEPATAAASLGLTGLSFTGATPVSLRLPESEAAKLEDK